MRHGKKTAETKKNMTIDEMFERTAPLIIKPVDEDGDLLRIDVKGKFIYNMDTFEISTPYRSTGDAYNVKILRFGKWKSFPIHRLVALTFCPRVPRRNVVHHINTDRSDNSAYNLLWVTRDEHATLHRLLRRREVCVYNEMMNRIYQENKQHDSMEA